MKVLIAGGAGYIGGVTTRLFEEAGHEVIVLDNLSTGHAYNLKSTKLLQIDLTDSQAVDALLDEHKFDAILDFAAKIQVEESTREPKLYFTNNAFGALNLVDAAVKKGMKNFIFSSTAAVYGEGTGGAVGEDDPKDPINPYGASKYIMEQILHSYGLSHDLNWVAFRYFNAAGGYQGIGPDYPEVTHLISRAIEAILGNGELTVFGSDYDTADGTGVRDYVHVYDIAQAHVIAAEKMVAGEKFNQPINLGSNHGSTVLEVIAALETVSGKKVPYIMGSRRAGDPGKLIASNDRAKKLLGWSTTKDLGQIAKDAWDWQTTKTSKKV